MKLGEVLYKLAEVSADNLVDALEKIPEEDRLKVLAKILDRFCMRCGYVLEGDWAPCGCTLRQKIYGKD